MGQVSSFLTLPPPRSPVIPCSPGFPPASYAPPLPALLQDPRLPFSFCTWGEESLKLHSSGARAHVPLHFPIRMCSHSWNSSLRRWAEDLTIYISCPNRSPESGRHIFDKLLESSPGWSTLLSKSTYLSLSDKRNHVNYEYFKPSFLGEKSFFRKKNISAGTVSVPNKNRQRNKMKTGK